MRVVKGNFPFREKREERDRFFALIPIRVYEGLLTHIKFPLVIMRRGSKDVEAFGATIPIDYYYIVYFILFWEGVGNLFPWNAFITASSYFAERFCGTYFEGEFENYFSITFTVSQTIGLALSIIYQDRITMRNKIVWPLLCYAVIFGVTTILVCIENIDASLLFYLTLISAFMCGICGAILSAGLFGLGAMVKQHTPFFPVHIEPIIPII